MDGLAEERGQRDTGETHLVEMSSPVTGGQRTKARPLTQTSCDQDGLRRQEPSVQGSTLGYFNPGL